MEINASSHLSLIHSVPALYKSGAAVITGTNGISETFPIVEKNPAARC
jgi:hypothetical protein